MCFTLMLLTATCCCSAMDLVRLFDLQRQQRALKRSGKFIIINPVNSKFSFVSRSNDCVQSVGIVFFKNLSEPHPVLFIHV